MLAADHQRQRRLRSTHSCAGVLERRVSHDAVPCASMDVQAVKRQRAIQGSAQVVECHGKGSEHALECHGKGSEQ